MTDLQLYQQLLGLTAPWAVQRVEVDPDQTEVRVYVAPAPETRFACPECQQPCPGYDTRAPRRWRHLDRCGFTTGLLAEVPRLQGPPESVRDAPSPFPGPALTPASPRPSEAHEEKLLAALETGVTHSYGEYVNGQIQSLRKRARGFRNAAAFRGAILFHLGKLDLCPHEFP